MAAGNGTRNQATMEKSSLLKKNLNASRPSKHPPVRGENVKTFKWVHRLQIILFENLCGATGILFVNASTGRHRA